jgi:hypothetical protein
VDGISVKRGASFWIIQIPGWIFLLYLTVAQGIPAFDYQRGVAWGTQESTTIITEVGAAFFYGFAFADLVFYIPLLFAALIAQARNARWWKPVMAAAMGITVYWPIVCLATVVDARNAPGWNLESEAQYWIALPLIALWGAVSLAFCCKRDKPQPA